MCLNLIGELNVVHLRYHSVRHKALNPLGIGPWPKHTTKTFSNPNPIVGSFS